MEPEPKDPNEEIDRKLGTPQTGAPPLSEDEAWGGKLNPVRETPLAGTNLRDVGR
jgi:hypothetical protein